MHQQLQRNSKNFEEKLLLNSLKDEQRHVSSIRLYINNDLSNGKNTNNNKKKMKMQF